MSTTNPSQVTFVEVNFTQSFTQTTNELSAPKGNVALVSATLNNNQITINVLGGQCDQGSLGLDSISGVFTSVTDADLTVSESQGGTVAAQVTFSSDGTHIVSGNYSAPAQCGYAEDSGSISGTQIQPFSGSYAGMLENSSGGQDAYIVTLSQSGTYLIVNGTDNGAQFYLAGNVIGGFFNISGIIDGQTEQVFGLYDNVNNNFVIFNIQGAILGTLYAGTNPQAVPKAPGLFAHTGWSH